MQDPTASLVVRSFRSYEIHNAAKISNTVSQWRKLANCTDIFNWAKKNKLILSKPQVPSVMLIPSDVSKGERPYKHTGIVVGYDPATGKLVTVEGNSNDDGSHNGIGVFQLNTRKA